VPVEAPSGVRLGRVVARLARHVEVALAALELSPSQYRTLGFLSGGPEHASRLADRLAIRPPSLTAVVDSLVARGLVERMADPGDRRRVGHRLTDEGRRTLAEADAAVEARLAELLGLVGAAAAEAAAAGLEAWQEPLDAFAAARRAQTT
jgi:long-chain acyl-CoA synthetase